MQVHSVESLAALDGEGIRYAIFLSGCPLRCIYCHNPDTWNCQTGEEKAPEELFAKIKRYKSYFKASGGGVTFSGGEPLLQADKINALAALLKSESIGYTLDTSGHVALTDSVKQAIDGADLVICDLKFPDEQTFHRYTGGDFSLVLLFLQYLLEHKKRIWVRTVIVPQLNDSTEWIDRYLSVLLPFREGIERYQLLGYHTMGDFKYEKLGIPNPLNQTPALDPNILQQLQQYADRFFK